jgi:single-strand DNA-binding protein
MNNFQLTGKVEEIFAEETVGKDLKKRSFILSNEEVKGENTFDHKFNLECLGDKTSLLNDIAVGQQVTASFNIKTTEWTKDNKKTYFTNLICWKIEK